ncbi:MAG: hypothetical protein AAGF84_12745 [Planctomycetota bacterium]
MARARSGGSPSAAWAVTLLGAGFLICGILAALFYAQKGGVEEELAEARSDLSAFVSAAQQSSPAVSEARQVANENGQTVVQVLLDRASAARNELAAANAEKDDLTVELADNARALEQARSDLSDAQQAQAAAAAGLAEARRTFEQEAAALARRVGAAEGANQQLQEDLETAQTALRASTEEARRQLQTTIDELRVANDGLDRQLASATDELTKLRTAREAQLAAIADPDARIASLQNNGNTAFLNIGRNQRVRPGMTFSVFDDDELVKLEDDPDQEPKAVLEVYDVLENSSIARVVELAPRQRLAEGDAAINLVFDPNRVFRFFVFGDFDLDQTGNPTAEQAERIKAQVQRWDSEVADEITFDVDYVVLGEPPALPRELTGGERADPIRIREYNAALQKFNEYAEYEEAAKVYNIPILNQNRFHDLVGYYEF